MKQKTILITGAGTGIGKDTAFALAKRGHRVIATTETEEQCDALQQEALQKNIQLEVYKLDVINKHDQESIKTYSIDVLINNAGIGQSGPLAEIDIDIVRRNFEVNVFSAFELTQLALIHMTAKQAGTVIFISSTAGRIPIPFLGPYCMTKFALSSGVTSMRQEMHRIYKNIHVCVVEPGAYHTGFNQRMVSSIHNRIDTASHFYSIRNNIHNRLDYFFRTIEVSSTQSIVRKIVRAVEAKKPRLRYVSPWWQGVGVRLLRIFGN